MIGFEYILSLYGVSQIELAKEFHITKQNINKWIKIKRKIPNKYLPILSERFKIPEEYFQKELDTIDKLKIQTIKLKNEIKDSTMCQERINEIVNILQGIGDK